MTQLIVKRLLLLPVLLFIFSVFSFIIIQAPPGDFVTSYIAELASSGSSMDQAQIDALRSTYGLDQPLTGQYLKWIGRILRGDLGVSLDWQKPIGELIGERLGLTVMLGLLTFFLSWALAVPIGIISAVKKYTLVDYFFTIFNYIGIATPTFMVALIAMWLAFSWFGVSVTGLFSSEYVDAPWSLARFGDLMTHMWLPVLILTLSGTARLARIMRANLLDELNKPYVEMARAKGMSEWHLIIKYPVRLALNPLVSTIGWYLPLIFSGSLVVATVLNLPTIGPMLLRSLTNQDMFLAGAIVLIYCLLAIIGTLVSDILLAWLDPRIRMES
ncbi:MAG: ABC transporter permease [Anaerolineae bacterium]|nr:ABC transporter permease [Anaerolineae bacterium]MCB9129527.1 ABC transporter permease [Anaerolineales bacterium]MCB0229796.1 ABC transporter permease [Anaerolineae bacterium]MCB0233657.1 ABC transporter permease [Anaerolineae bacterium]MCB0237119.1 ABC transporter permease [Anaerolineae bacterium]